MRYETNKFVHTQSIAQAAFSCVWYLFKLNENGDSGHKNRFLKKDQNFEWVRLLMPSPMKVPTLPEFPISV